ncbi:hypothetical protein NQZ68_035341 [Dissostichus eleginoides]|nr:hypothetical protein NQZ68_035341 [Dissostichus eleginoides]
MASVPVDDSDSEGTEDSEPDSDSSEEGAVAMDLFGQLLAAVPAIATYQEKTAAREPQVVAPVCISKLGAYRPSVADWPSGRSGRIPMGRSGHSAHSDHSAHFGSSPLTAAHYMIAEDQTIVSVPNVVDALMLMFAPYYCVNISYRSELGVTLEFLQRCLFKVNPDKGTKVERKE